jgi:mono/diheme cytochrome c family protein
LLKNSTLRLILSGAALRRCGITAFLSVASAAEVTFSNRRLVFPRTAKPSLAVILLALLFSTYALADSGADIYKTKCSACHGKNGAGDTMLGKNLKLRPLGSDDVQERSDDELFTIISKGKNRMPPFDRKLSKDQIHDVVKYIRSLKK